MLETQIGLLYARARTRVRLSATGPGRRAAWRRAGTAVRRRLGRP